jgi:hypothetical protein
VNIFSLEEAKKIFPHYDELLYKEEKSKDSKRNKKEHNDWTPSKVLEVIDLLKEELPEYFQFFNLHIRSVILDRISPYGSASASDTIGLISLNCKNEYTKEDLIEMIIHELVHNLFFIDNFANPHFKNGIRELEVNVLSPIRKEERKAHLSLHALIVGVELLKLRERRRTVAKESNIHPNTLLLLKNCERSTQELLKSKILSNHGTKITTRIQNYLSTFRTNHEF